MLKATEAAPIVGYSRSKFYDMVRDGFFPKGKTVGKSTRWPEDVVLAYSILYWGLNRPLPQLTPEEESEILEAINAVKSALV